MDLTVSSVSIQLYLIFKLNSFIFLDLKYINSIKSGISGFKNMYNKFTI